MFRVFVSFRHVQHHCLFVPLFTFCVKRLIIKRIAREQ